MRHRPKILASGDHDHDLERVLDRLTGADHPEDWLALADDLRGYCMQRTGDACPTCVGAGRRWYSHGSTWRGGVSTCSCAYDICDACWGSGSASRPGYDLRAAEQRERDARAASFVDHLLRRLHRIGVSHLPTIADKLARCRWPREDLHLEQTARLLCSVLREAASSTGET